MFSASLITSAIGFALVLAFSGSDSFASFWGAVRLGGLCVCGFIVATALWAIITERRT
jgi:hypothetical protein